MTSPSTTTAASPCLQGGVMGWNDEGMTRGRERREMDSDERGTQIARDGRHTIRPSLASNRSWDGWRVE
jgi:hypothetical protein